MKYNLVICGGTFDHFHKGHASFLQSALMLSKHVLLGVTSDAYVQEYKSSTVESFAVRKKAVENFLKQHFALERVTIAPIHTVLYPIEWESLPIEAIIVTQETKKGAEIINQKRKQKGLSPLTVVVLSLVTDDIKQKISSSNIREGKINRHGVSYIQSSWFAEDLLLPDIEKQWFKKPLGKLITEIATLKNDDPQKLVTVGDVITRDYNALQLHQKLSIIDFTIQRKPTFHQIQDLGFSGEEKVFNVTNPPSHLTPELFNTIMKAITYFSEDKQLVIVVHGEEDLAVIPLVLALPLGFIVVYGQPHEGVVRLSITPKIKDYAYNLLQRFVSVGA